MLCGLPFLFGYFLIVSASIATSPVAFKALLIVGIFVAGIGSGWSFLAVPVSYIIILLPYRWLQNKVNVCFLPHRFI